MAGCCNAKEPLNAMLQASGSDWRKTEGNKKKLISIRKKRFVSFFCLGIGLGVSRSRIFCGIGRGEKFNRQFQRKNILSLLSRNRPGRFPDPPFFSVCSIFSVATALVLGEKTISKKCLGGFGLGVFPIQGLFFPAFSAKPAGEEKMIQKRNIFLADFSCLGYWLF